MLAPLLASLALLGAGEPVCHGQHAPSTPEERRQGRIEHYVDARASFGFRSDVPYIQELIRRDQWEYDVGEFPATRAENRYLRLHARLDLGGRAHRYLRAHRDLFGGVSIEEGWPREPYLLVRLTRGRARHEAALRRLVRFPDNLRTVKVVRSERQLNRLANRIGRDRRELDAAGFQLSGWGAEIVTNTVDVELITARTDHAEYFARRYGPVTTNVIATEPTRLECNETEAFEVSPDGSSLVLRWGSGSSRELERVELTEHADRVEVGIVERVPNEGELLDQRFRQRTVALSAPLGDRAVIDAASGLRLRQSGPSPGEPPCPPPPSQSELDTMIEARRDAGLPHARAYVRRMLRRPTPFTEAEQRYLAARNALIDARVRAYLRRHRNTLGGAVIAGRFPGRPVLVVRVVRRWAYHQNHLWELLGRRVRPIQAPYTEAELLRIERRIEREAEAGGGFLDGWGDDGILLRFTEIEAGRVIVEVVSPRDDYARALRALYGSAVKAVRVGTRHECVPTLF